MSVASRISALFAAAALLLPIGASAQVACYGPTSQLPAQVVADFLANPGQLLQQFGQGGPSMISQVRDLAASSPAAVPLILDLIRDANPMQVDAVGSGMGQAALICLKQDQAFATEIQQLVAAINNDTLTLAFAAVFGDKPIGAVGGGGGGGGGPTNPLFGALTGFGGGPSPLPNTSTVNKGTNFFTFSSATGATPGIGTNSVSTSVSPTH
jgi:hypothetical protein